MSESRDRAMRRSRGTSRNVIDGKVKKERARQAGQHEQVVFPSPEAVKEAVLAGVCPCCGKGPFTLLARHTHAQHGIDTRQLRDLAGLTYSESITPAAFQEQRSRITTDLIAAGKLWSPGGVKGRTASPSKAGKERMKRKPGKESPPCVNCGRPARRKDTSNWRSNPGPNTGGWNKTCSDECAEARARANYEARTKPRPACVVCGATIPTGRSRAYRVKTCGDACQRVRRQQTMRETRRRQINGEEPTP